MSPSFPLPQCPNQPREPKAPWSTLEHPVSRGPSCLLGAFLLLIAPLHSAFAVVADSSEIGFTVQSSVTVPVDAKEAYDKLVDVASWWDPEHTWSGESRNLTLDTRPGGCFCELLPEGGGVQHLEVVWAQRGQVLRLRGALGPLQDQGVDGALAFTMAAVPEGTGTVVQLTYRVGGYVPGGISAWSTGVDFVLTTQLNRYAALFESADK